MNRTLFHRGGVVVLVALAAVASVALPARAATGRADLSGDPVLTGAEKILTYVPSDARATCGRRDPSSFANASYKAAVAVVQCSSPADGVSAVVYALYPDAATMNSDFGSIVPTGLASMSASDGCTGAGTWAYKDQASGGSDACFIDTAQGQDATGKMAWTSDASLILGLAVSLSGDGTALKKWWNASSGPLEQPDSVDFASMLASDRVAAGKALVHQTSKSVSKCKLVDAAGYTPDEASWEWLPWIAAEELCKVPRGVVYYMQATPETAQGYWNALHDQLTDSGYPGTKHPAACNKPRALLNAKNHQIGQVQCWYFHTGLWASWYNQDTGIVGAASADTTPKKIFDYLNRNKLQ